MKSIWKLPGFLLVVCLTPLPSNAAAPVSPATEANTSAKTVTKVDAKSQPKAQSKAQSKVKPKSVAKAKPQASEAKSRAVATPNSQPEGTKSASPGVSGSSLAVSGFKESDLNADTAAARQAVTDSPGDTAARERLARISAKLVDDLLRAEASGNTAKVGELTRKLTAGLHDTGWRVQKMAQDGDLTARQATGFLLGRGLLLEMDANRSCVEFLIAAEQLATSGWYAANCLMKISPDRAWMEMERSAMRGHSVAQEWMGRRCLGEFGVTASDYACARTWLAQSASQGRPRSQTLLAYLMMNGHGGSVDESRAARLYRLAADQGDADAQNNLGEINEMGRGAVANPEEALRWYLSAAEQGLASAQFNAGRLLAIGAGNKKDPARARSLLLQAEGKGITQARQVLNWLDRQGVPEQREPAAQTPTPVPVGESKRE
jgi:TPR repeat protein